MAETKAQARLLPSVLLRSASQQLLTTPKEHLLGIVPRIAGDLAACSSLLAKPLGHKDGRGSEEALAVRRFTTQLSALLQDRGPECRWAGVVLIKATVEYGGLDILQRNSTWVKNLLTLLSKPNPSTIRLLTILALTRIFIVTHDHPGLTRELTTPSLPPFIAACLDIVKLHNAQRTGDSSVIWAILESFNHLLPLHPTTFRPFQTQLQDLLRFSIVPTSDIAHSSISDTEHIRKSAKCLFVRLHRCAPRAAAAEEWQSLMSATVESAHGTADLVFRSLIEFWRGERPKLPTGPIEIESESGSDALRLPGWKGIRAGCERLIHILRLLECIFRLSNSTPVSGKIGLVLALLRRLFMVRVPSPEDEKLGKDPLYNAEVSKEELLGLLQSLPSVHTSALELSITMIDRLGAPLLSSVPTDFLSFVVRPFDTEKLDLSLRAKSYRLLKTLIEKKGCILNPSLVGALSAVMMECSLDCLAINQDLIVDQRGNAVLEETQKRAAPRRVPKELQQAASTLLPVLLTKLPTPNVSLGSRARMDQAAILSGNHEALVGSTLNPSARFSVMPFLLRASPRTAESEAILRPRLPPIGISTTRLDGAFDGYPEQQDSDGESEQKSPEGAGAQQDRLDNDMLVTNTSVQDELGKRKRLEENAPGLQNFELPTRSGSGNDESFLIPSERSEAMAGTTDSESMGAITEESLPTDSEPKTRPFKRVRFSDPEAELLSQSTSSVNLDGEEEPTPAPIPSMVASSSEEHAQDEVTRTHNAEDDEDDEDEDKFEVPPLIIKQGTDEDEGSD
ncbi:MAG: hypothetical protein Q9165_004061 [Trypethelium subeluteriae]